MKYLWNDDGSDVALFYGDGSPWGTWSDERTAVKVLGASSVTIPGQSGAFEFVQFPPGSVLDSDNQPAAAEDLFAYAPKSALHAQPPVPGSTKPKTPPTPKPGEPPRAPTASTPGVGAGTIAIVAVAAVAAAWWTSKKRKPAA